MNSCLEGDHGRRFLVFPPGRSAEENTLRRQDDTNSALLQPEITAVSKPVPTRRQSERGGCNPFDGIPPQAESPRRGTLTARLGWRGTTTHSPKAEIEYHIYPLCLVRKTSRTARTAKQEQASSTLAVRDAETAR